MESIRHHELDDGRFDPLFLVFANRVELIPSNDPVTRADILCMFDETIMQVDSVLQRKNLPRSTYRRRLMNTMRQCVYDSEDDYWLRLRDKIRRAD